MQEQKKNIGLSASTLKLLAMGFMLLDHLWATVVPGNLWMTCVGRLAFPIFAFQIAEGWIKTGDRRRYVHRLLLCAVLAEVPFDLMLSGAPVFLFHQNVIWTFLLALWVIHSMEQLRTADTAAAKLRQIAAILGALVLSTIGFVDYSLPGVLTVVGFWMLRGRTGEKAGQLALLGYINCVMLEGQMRPIGGLELPLQGFAVLALPLIWLYDGRQGLRGRGWRYISYGFYPLHMLLLWGIAQVL